MHLKLHLKQQDLFIILVLGCKEAALEVIESVWFYRLNYTLILTLLSLKLKKIFTSCVFVNPFPSANEFRQ